MVLRDAGKVGRDVPSPCLHNSSFLGCIPGAVSGPSGMKEVVPKQRVSEAPGRAGGGLVPEDAGFNPHPQPPGLFKEEVGNFPP